MKLLVTGLPGVGKTSLLQALAETAPNPAGFLTLEVLNMLTFSILRSDLMSLTLSHKIRSFEMRLRRCEVKMGSGLDLMWSQWTEGRELLWQE